MLIIHGTYRLWPRRVAFRNDYCMTCEQASLAEQIRTFNFFHLYFIPVIPVGVWNRWRCCRCGLCPRQIRLTKRLLEFLLLGVFIFCAVFFWTLYALIGPILAEDPALYWLFGIISPPGAVAVAAHVVICKPAGPSYKELLQSLPLADHANCPFCGTPMADEYFECRCPNCGVRRL